MSHGTPNDRRENVLSKMVDGIFDRYTSVIPSSVADEEEIDELRESLENLEADNSPTPDNTTSHAQREGRHDNNNSVQAGDGTVDPRETQLASTSRTTYGRKTIPLAVWNTMPPQHSPANSSSSSNSDPAVPPPSILNIDSESDDNAEGTKSCERCFENNIKCRPNISSKGTAAACHNCRLKRKKCSLVPNPKPQPGARGISTPPDEFFDSFRSEIYDITDSNDESFDMDSYRVTLQRVFGKVSYLTKVHEGLETRLSRIEAKQDLILKKLEENGQP